MYVQLHCLLILSAQPCSCRKYCRSMVDPRTSEPLLHIKVNVVENLMFGLFQLIALTPCPLLMDKLRVTLIPTLEPMFPSLAMLDIVLVLL